MTRDDAQDAWVRIVDTGFSSYDLLTKDEKIWFNIEPLTTDGLIDHYINNGAEHNKDTIDALKFLGFDDIAQLMLEINSLFKDGHPPADIYERNAQWDTWCAENGELLDRIDEAFWKRNDALEKKLLEHILKTNIGKP